MLHHRIGNRGPRWHRIRLYLHLLHWRRSTRLSDLRSPTAAAPAGPPACLPRPGPPLLGGANMRRFQVSEPVLRDLVARYPYYEIARMYKCLEKYSSSNSLSVSMAISL